MNCKEIKVPREVCYIKFKKDKIKSTKEIGYTNRKEWLLFDYNKKGEIIGIELISNYKPCQK